MGDVQEITKDELFEHTESSPVHHINNIHEHPDDGCKLLYNAMQDRAWDILTSPEVIEYYENTNCPIGGFADLTQGHCEDITTYAYEVLRDSEHDHTKAKVMCLIDERDALYASHHCWIQMDMGDGTTYNFDVNTPWGVSNYKHLLPIYRNPGFACVIAKPVVFNPLYESKVQVFGIHGYEYDIFGKRRDK